VEAVEEDASLVSLVVEVVVVVAEDQVEDLLPTSSPHLGVVFLLLMVHQRPSRSKVFHIIGVPSAATGTKLMSPQLTCVVLLPLEIMVMILIALLLQILSWIHLRGWSLRKDGILILVTTVPVTVAKAVIFTATAWSIQRTVATKFLQLECAPVVETMASMPTFATVEEVFLKRLLSQVMMMMVLMMRSQLSALPVLNSSHLE